jgi:gas vesicle protein
MEPDNVKSPSQLAEEARQTGHDALVAAQGYAQESKRIGSEVVQSIRSGISDARETGSEALDTVKGLSSDARDLSRDAAKTGKAYATDALHAAGAKVQHAKDACTQYIAEEPVRATLLAAASGAILTSLMLRLMRGRRRY